MANDGLAAVVGAAFDEAMGGSEPASTSSEPETTTETTQEPAEATTEEPTQTVPDQPQAQEETGDVLLDKLTPEQIAELKKDPRLRAIYKGLMSSYTPKMQQFAEQARLWDALNNPETQRGAVEALARSVGLDIRPTDQPQRDQAAKVADSISDEWSKVVGPEAAQLLRPLIEKTALAAVQGTLAPVQQGVEYLQLDAKARQAEAQVAQFSALAEKKGWKLTPEIQRRMAQIGLEMAPTRRNPVTGQLEIAPIESVEKGVQFLEKIWRLATADTAESDAEKRIFERMKKAAQSAEPQRGVPSTGREKRTSITKDMDLNQALDVAVEEALADQRSR